MTNLLSVFGALSTVIGTLLLYRYGLPGRLTSTGDSLISVGPTPGSPKDLRQKRQARRERALAGLALLLVAAGSVVPALPAFYAVLCELIN